MRPFEIGDLVIANNKRIYKLLSFSVIKHYISNDFKRGEIQLDVIPYDDNNRDRDYYSLAFSGDMGMAEIDDDLALEICRLRAEEFDRFSVAEHSNRYRNLANRVE